LLGIATEFTLQLEPSSRTVVETRNNLDDTQIVADVSKMLEEETPHVIVYWRPDFGTYRAIMWTPVLDGSVYNPAGGSSEEPAFRSNARSMYLDPLDDQIAGDLNKLMAAWEEDTAEESPIADQLNSGTHRHHASDEFNSFIKFFLHSHTQSKPNLCNQSIVLTTSRRSQDLMQGYSENMTTMNC
jgi:hypothetical protein